MAHLLFVIFFETCFLFWLIFLDCLFSGTPVVGFDGIPYWNQISEDHIKSSLVVANAVMDDLGWVLVITSPAHLSLVERVASRTGMVAGFRWALNSSEPYSYETRLGVSTKVMLPCAFILIIK